MRLASPGFAVVTAGVVIIVHAGLTLKPTVGFNAAEAVGVALLLLATLQPAVVFLEQEQLRRERDAARSQERALRIVNARMEAFLSMVAHELRTPLTSLTANVQLMARRMDTLLRLVKNGDDYAGTARVLRDLIQWSDQSLERMRRMVDDVLDDTLVRQGRLALRLEAVDVVSVAGRAVAEQLALNPGRSIHWVVKTSPILVLADASRIDQVVKNYVSNALKFSRTNQAVEVRIERDDGEVLVSVHDDGVGVPSTDQPHIWEQYYQATGRTYRVARRSVSASVSPSVRRLLRDTVAASASRARPARARLSGLRFPSTRRRVPHRLRQERRVGRPILMANLTPPDAAKA